MFLFFKFKKQMPFFKKDHEYAYRLDFIFLRINMNKDLMWLGYPLLDCTKDTGIKFPVTALHINFKNAVYA